MDVREKLVELLAEKCMATCRERGLNVCSAEHCNKHKEECTGYYADHLISHGVTVRECGEWVYDHWCEFKCSVCGEFSSSKPYKGKENYCSNCGAKMDGGDEDEQS